MNFTFLKVRSRKFIGLPDFTCLLLSFLLVCTNGYPRCLNERIMFFNRDSNRVEIYRVQDPTKEIEKSDLLWYSPTIDRADDIYSGAGYEIKPITYKGQKAILATTRNGVIIYSYPKKEILFHRNVFGWLMFIHSALPLPDGNVLVADTWGSIGILYPGNTISEINQLSVKTTWYTLPFPHALVYDNASGLIYAGGYMTVQSYRYKGTGSSATLEPVTKYDLRDYYFRCSVYGKCDEGAQWEDGIHDIYPASKTNPHLFFLSTGERTFLFDTSKQTKLNYPADSIPIKLKDYQPFYEMESKYSQQEAPNSRKDSVILKKSGIKALSGSLEKKDYCVIGHTAPFFTLSLQYDYYAPVIVYAESPADRVDYDLTTKNHLQFAQDVKAHFYKARLLPDDF